MAAIVDSAEDAIISKNLDGTISSWNTGAERLFGFTAEEAVGKHIALLLPLDVQHEEDHTLAEIRRGQRVDSYESVRRHKDGRRLDVSVTVSPIRDAHGNVVGASKIARDITARKVYERRLEEHQRQLEGANARLAELAATDGLTGLKNHVSFHEHLDQAYARARRSGLPLSVIMLDVDYFKEYNDRYGHPAGDEVLKSMARLLLEQARRSDFVARYGGEEFAVVLPDTDSPGAIMMAERFRRTIEDNIWLKRAVTASLGAATISSRTSNRGALLQEADAALYEAKRQGRNRVIHASQLYSRT